MNDLTGQRFGRLLVLNREGSDRNKNALWRCRCDCGTEKVVCGRDLKNGDTKSCGCLHRESVKQTMTTHGLSKTRLYRVWAGMKNRCYNQHCDNYQYYGAKGVTMCDEWRNSFSSFKDWAIENGYDDTQPAQGCTIDRIDNTLGYTPANCRWANHIEQCNNQGSNKILTFNGKSMTIADWAREIGIKYTTLRARIRNGMTVEDALSLPVRRLSTNRSGLSRGHHRISATDMRTERQ